MIVRISNQPLAFWRETGRFWFGTEIALIWCNCYFIAQAICVARAPLNVEEINDVNC
jgi:hypothetical protein